ncbi:ubiquinone biosynthesis protein UbiE [Merismopedia glauca CCAP 1448/3]|uniref:Ubiquinone biosynthesis protein UbiE n=2 Tax=Merismopedia TaxID=53402 RepID=A0A2T1C2G9_9CYAN|nr:ubiquinone biosynthesis protein UbiE [Merismopedia glauca CCAP 1448/3]
MGHREIYTVLHELLVSHFQKPFRMLELGCGDASFTAQALVDTNIAAYQGIDLSEVALEIAEENLAAIAIETILLKGDLSNFTNELPQNKPQQFDIIMTSFALHHLDLAQKDSVINNISNCLNPDGIFILIDVVRQENEEREAYIRRYLNDVEQRWSMITPQEYSMVENHISASDFPETQQTLRQLAAKHNFSRVECLYGDRLDTTQLLCFYR